DSATFVDTQAPPSSASSPTYSTSTSITVTSTASDPDKNGVHSGLAKLELYAKAPAATSYTVYATDSGAGIDNTFTYTATVDGTYSFYTVATDTAGNVEAAPASFDSATFVDTREPDSTIDTGP